MNPLAMQLLQMIRNGGNPQQLVISMMEAQAKGNPVLENLISMAKKGNTRDIEKVARNMVNSKGGDYDKEFNDFKRKFGL